MLVLHSFVKTIEVLLAPIAAIGRPSAVAGLHPGVISGEIVGVLRRRFVLVKQYRRRFPTAAVFADAVPIDFAVLGENENHRTSVVSEVCITVRSFGADIGLVGFVECGHGSVGLLRVFVFSFVV